MSAALAVPLAAVLGGLARRADRLLRRRVRIAVAWIVLDAAAPARPSARDDPAPAVALPDGLAARRDLRVDGIGVLRPERLAPGRLRRAGLERRVRGDPFAGMNITAIPASFSGARGKIKPTDPRITEPRVAAADVSCRRCPIRG